MKKDWALTQDAFDKLLEWLDPDRERAGIKYEAIRTRLIKIFICRGCTEAEELADETINRVASKLDTIIKDWQGDPALYFFSVAQFVWHEWLRVNLKRSDLEGPDISRIPTVTPANDDEVEYECLVQCMQELRENERVMVIEYYQERGRAKIRHHQQMAIALGIAVNALRIRACRIRRQLKLCVQNCRAATLNGNDSSM